MLFMDEMTFDLTKGLPKLLSSVGTNVYASRFNLPTCRAPGLNIVTYMTRDVVIYTAFSWTPTNGQSFKMDLCNALYSGRIKHYTLVELIVVLLDNAPYHSGEMLKTVFQQVQEMTAEPNSKKI